MTSITLLAEHELLLAEVDYKSITKKTAYKRAKLTFKACKIFKKDSNIRKLEKKFAKIKNNY